eukprot:21121-Pelagococcus_subviridis.AAC.18
MRSISTLRGITSSRAVSASASARCNAATVLAYFFSIFFSLPSSSINCGASGDIVASPRFASAAFALSSCTRRSSICITRMSVAASPLPPLRTTESAAALSFSSPRSPRGALLVVSRCRAPPRESSRPRGAGPPPWRASRATARTSPWRSTPLLFAPRLPPLSRAASPCPSARAGTPPFPREGCRAPPRGVAGARTPRAPAPPPRLGRARSAPPRARVTSEAGPNARVRGPPSLPRDSSGASTLPPAALASPRARERAGRARASPRASCSRTPFETTPFAPPRRAAAPGVLSRRRARAARQSARVSTPASSHRRRCRPSASASLSSRSTRRPPRSLVRCSGAAATAARGRRPRFSRRRRGAGGAATDSTGARGTAPSRSRLGTSPAGPSARTRAGTRTARTRSFGG